MEEPEDAEELLDNFLILINGKVHIYGIGDTGLVCLTKEPDICGVNQRKISDLISDRIERHSFVQVKKSDQDSI